MTALKERLHELGYREGKTMAFEYRSADRRPERLPQLAREIIRDRPDVLVAGFGTLTAQAAKAATTTIPIVFTTVGDPVGSGLVASLGRPGGNVTGLSGLPEIGGKHLQLLQELSPGKQVVAVLMNPETPFTRLALKQIEIAAQANRTRLEILETRTADQVPRALQEAVTAGAGSLLVLVDPLLFSLRREIVDLSAKFRLPAVYPSSEWAEAGGLMSYGADRRQMYRRAAEYVDKILKGAKPGDLPVEPAAGGSGDRSMRTAVASRQSSAARLASGGCRKEGSPCGGGSPAIHSRTRRMMSYSIVGDRTIAEGGRLNQ